jgi:hypothetical protein
MHSFATKYRLGYLLGAFFVNSSGHPGNVVIAPNLYLRLPTVREKFKKPEQEFLQPQPQLVDVGETAP